jgi:hypothetical protein
MRRFGLDTTEVPRAAFKSLSASIEDDARILADRLGAELKKWPLAKWAVKLQVAGTPFLAGLGRREKDLRVLVVAPSSSGPSLLDLLRGRKVVSYSPELLQACREINTVLTASSEFSAVRWYFEGLGTQTAAVATPDELPWRQQA